MALKKKIRIIIGSLNVGGTEKQLVEIINNLAVRNWHIELITIKEKGKLANYLNKKIKLINLDIKVPFKILKFFFIVSKLYIIFRKNPDTLTHFFLPQSYILGMISSILANNKSKLIMSRRSLNIYQKQYPFSKTIEKFLHKKIDRILVNSKAVKKQLIKEEDVNKNKIKVIYNGIKIKNKIKKKLVNFNIVIIANLIAYKNHTMLLNALNLIKERLPKNWKLYCIGRDDGIKKNLIKLSKKLSLSNNIVWIESLKFDSILSKCNLGILCSKEESFPNAILEYFSLKIPVITTDVGGCSEIVKNYKNGIILKKNNHVELSKAILYLYKNKVNLKIFGDKGFQTIKKSFSIKKTITEHEKEYLRYVNP